MVRLLRRRLSRLWDHVQSYGKRGYDRALNLLAEYNRPRAPNQKGREERVKHISTVLNILAGACFGIGVVTPIAQHREMDWQVPLFAALSVAFIGAARRVLRYIPDEAVEKDPGHG